jgi:hypothetical protein
MADICGDLWQFNLARVVVIDVTDDYELMQPPLPSDCYPVLKEILVPRHGLSRWLTREELVHGYLYDWHDRPDFEGGLWYVGVVREELAQALLSEVGLPGR